MCSNSGDTLSLSEKSIFEKRYHHLAENDMNTDCEFIVGSDKVVIKGHKVIFSAASDVFQAMFYGQLKQDKPVKVEDLSPEGFEGMKTFIYSGEISFTSAFHALSPYIAARKYLVPQLCSECISFIKEKLQPSEVLEFCDLCRLNNITEFEELCSKIIEEKTDEVVESEYFTFAEMDTIELVLKSPSLKLRSEIEVFYIFQRWALAEVERKEFTVNQIATSFNNLKRHIRFLTISGEEFVSRIGESALLTLEEKHAIVVNQIKFESRPIPESLSISQHPRNFSPKKSEYNQCRHSFVVPINNTSYASTENNIILTFGTSSLKVYCYTFDEFISFKLQTHYQSIKVLLIIKSKFRILGVKECDDLVFENEYKDIVDTSRSASQSSQYITLAVIPISKVKNERFLRSISNKTINIEGSFKVEKINL